MSAKDLVKAILSSDESRFNEIATPESSLEAATFKNAHVGAIRIHTVDAENTEWEACLFDGTTFDGISLQGAFFNGCSFHHCTFKNAILAEASFDGCVWLRSTITEAEDLEAIELTNCQFKECEFSDLHFVDGTLESLTFSAGTLRNLSGIAQLKSVALRGVDVESFDTSEMTIASCTASSCTNIPKGFTASEGKRRRV